VVCLHLTLIYNLEVRMNLILKHSSSVKVQDLLIVNFTTYKQ
jgi:hypothetical protein